MNWFLIALLPPALWSITNHMDKYLLSKFFKGGGVGALMIFSSIIGLFLLPIIYIFNPNVFEINPITALLIALNGFFYILAVLPYFYALNKDDASIVVPLFQMIPVVSYILGFFILGETLQQNQIIGGLFVMLGAIGISLEISEGKPIRFKSEIFWLMLLSSVLFSLNFLFFKFFAGEQRNFWVTSFWEYSGFVLFAFLLLVFVKPYRKEFISVMRENKIPVLGLNGLNEVINIIAKLSFNFASLLVPVTLTWIVNGFQPLFVFIYGLVLTVLFPHIAKEQITKRHILQKLIAILFMFVGGVILNV